MRRDFWDRWFPLPHENDGDLNPVKVDLFTKLRLNHSDGRVVLDLAPEIHSDVTV